MHGEINVGILGEISQNHMVENFVEELKGIFLMNSLEEFIQEYFT